MDGKKQVKSDNYGPVVRIGIRSGIFQCVVEIRRSDYFAIGDE